jgi:urease accessory protein
MATSPVAERADAQKPSSLSTLLLLADGRFPAGGHAHSGGLEASIARENVRDIPRLEAFLHGRAATAGAVAAAFAAAACAAISDSAVAGDARAGAERVSDLDCELDARIPSPVVRAASRRLGRQVFRAGRAIWPDPRLDALSVLAPRGLHQPVVLGAVSACAGLDAAFAAAAATHEAVTGPATAAVRILGLDPFEVHAVLARLGPELDAIAAAGASYANAPPADLPAWSAPLLDLLAEHHATWEVRLFAS